MQRTIFDEQHELFRAGFRRFVEQEITPHVEHWEAAGICDRELFAKAGQAGFLGLAAPAKLGGGATPDFRFSQIMLEEYEAAGAGTAGSGIGCTTMSPCRITCATARPSSRHAGFLDCAQVI